MTKLEPDEVLFEIKDGTEYATLHADSFRTAMRQRDWLQAEVGRQERRFREAEAEWVERFEKLAAEREHLIEAAHQIQSRLTVCQTHEAGWRERAEKAEAEIERLGRELQRCQEAPYG